MLPFNNAITVNPELKIFRSFRASCCLQCREFCPQGFGHFGCTLLFSRSQLCVLHYNVWNGSKSKTFTPHQGCFFLFFFLPHLTWFFCLVPQTCTTTETQPVQAAFESFFSAGGTDIVCQALGNPSKPPGGPQIFTLPSSNQPGGPAVSLFIGHVSSPALLSGTNKLLSAGRLVSFLSTSWKLISVWRLKALQPSH